MAYRRDAVSGVGVRGVPALVWLAMITRIQKSDMTIMARINLAVKYFSLLRAKFKDDPHIAEKLQELQTDIEKLRWEYEPLIEAEEWAAEKHNEFNVHLDGIEYRLDEIMVETKIIDTAGLQEFSVPE